MEIACIVGQEFEDSELRVPVERLREAGHHVMIVGEKRGITLRGKQGKEKVTADLSIDEVSPEQFDALLIPGGHSPDHLRADRRFVDFVDRFDRSGKLVATVCHGPQLLITAGRVQGRKMTAWKTVQEDLRQAGAKVVDREVVEDGNLITSRNPGDLEAFSDAIIQRLDRSGGRARRGREGTPAR